MKYAFSILLFASLFFLPKKSDEPVTAAPTIQVALLLDTSGSMSGLINQAKSQLWNILNKLSDTEHNGQLSTIEVALYQYGANGNKLYNNYIKQVVPFTSNVDQLSEALFALQINGSEEYCGEVLRKSLENLEWREGSALKTIFIAGNESFGQGPYAFEKACSKARKNGVVVNTIYCGKRETGIHDRWDVGAELGLGSYNFISQDEATVYIETPFDQRITDLNAELNETYVAINNKGIQAKENMYKQDKNASVYGGSNVAMRSVYKSKSNYNNASWDLVDAYRKDKKIINKVSTKQGRLQGKSKNEIEVFAAELSEKRTKIQQEIQSLSKSRDLFIRENTTKNPNDFQTAIENSLAKLLINKGFKTVVEVEKETSGISDTEQIDYPGFLSLSNEVSKYRAERLIDWTNFQQYADDENTIILDTRSAAAYNISHIPGSIHLNFSEFTEAKLAKVIPSKDTRILIYCNNNFTRGIPAMAMKSAPLALNIPTFIHLYGYGYKNIYELKSEIGKNTLIINNPK